MHAERSLGKVAGIMERAGPKEKKEKSPLDNLTPPNSGPVLLAMDRVLDRAKNTMAENDRGARHRPISVLTRLAFIFLEFSNGEKYHIIPSYH